MAANWPPGSGLHPGRTQPAESNGWAKSPNRAINICSWLLVAGAMSVILHAKRRGTTNLPWLADIIARKPTKVAAVALANKNARIVWALLKHGGTYQRPVTVPVV